MTGVGLDQRPAVPAREVVPPHPPSVPTRGDVPSYLPAVLTRGDDPLTARGGPTSASPAADQRILARRTFPGLPSQVTVARRWLAQMIDGFAAVDDVLLASSELASNAVIHSDSGLPDGVFTIRLAISGEYVRVEVLDQGGQWKGRGDGAEDTRDPRQDDGQCGRGLAVVAAISRAWGIAGDQEGRIAWCEIDSE
jgi:serine/threonine-protein kinase RsbW